MTFSQFKKLGRAMIPQAKKTTVSDTVVELIINNAVDDIAIYTKCLKANQKFNVVAEQQEYSLSSLLTRYLVVEKSGLYWNDGTASVPDWRQLDPVTLKYMDEKISTWRDDSSDSPLRYAIENDVLFIHPKPDTNLSNGFHIYFAQAPVSMTAASNYPFTGSNTELTQLRVFDNSILAYVTWKLKMMVNKGADDYRAGERAYLEERERAKVLFNRRPDISAVTKMQGRKYGC